MHIHGFMSELREEYYFSFRIYRRRIVVFPLLLYAHLVSSPSSVRIYLQKI